MAAFDNDMMFRTTGNLTTAGSLGPLTVRDTPVAGVTVRVSVPTAFHADDTLLAKVYGSSDNSTYHLIAQAPEASNLKATPKDIMIPVAGAMKYLKLELLMTTTTASNLNFGVVQAGIGPYSGDRNDVDRSVDWS